MKQLPTLLILLCLLPFGMKATDLFKASQRVELRAPSVPLITSDTYLSVWSPYNTLNEGQTEHWTGADHPLLGALRVDGRVYRFMGKDKLNLSALLPMTQEETWKAAYTFTEPSVGWEQIDYKPEGWREGPAAFGTSDMPRIGTPWTGKDIWVRREFNLDKDMSLETLYLRYSHDDIFELYLNGEKLVATDYSWNNDVTLELSPSAKKKLRVGRNILAAHCHNQAGGAYLDFGLYKENKQKSNFTEEAVQKSISVLPTQTFYTFQCGPVELDVVFTAPLLMEDIDLVATPINCISYRVRSMDKKEHDVQVYIETTPEMAVHEPSQPTISTTYQKDGMTYLKSGTIDQPYAKRTGDGVRIDWGYLYMAAPTTPNKTLSIGRYFDQKQHFIETGSLPFSSDNFISRSGGGKCQPFRLLKTLAKSAQREKTAF